MACDNLVSRFYGQICRTSLADGFSPPFPVIPPSVGNAAKIARLRRRPAENVPIGDPVRGLVPVAESNSGRPGSPGRAPGRRSTKAGRESAAMMVPISASTTGSAMPARLLRTVQRRRLRRKIRAQRIAGRRGKAEAVDCDVEIEVVERAPDIARGRRGASVASMPRMPRFLMNGIWCGCTPARRSEIRW